MAAECAGTCAGAFGHAIGHLGSIRVRSTPALALPTPWLTIEARLTRFSKSTCQRRQDHG
ncbi:hypothetical protein OCU_11790 [Mycobacterium intracellulare ATCC 13950]|uniref:Uncharacterized protein n=1 Tax=Mycobacterium intracellulare (strain ATCC 13950 / DSM 43223 / JCM 6384 / NCTC 13025 / 3600) TaxID=487521 RepID=H8IVM3_MYCIA|nr:hypothetical protein OCU_11790 [Mycobacterium intracellulare ATCC 13950]